MKLSVIIVNYNVKYYVEQCLTSLFRALEGIEAEVFVVDNHSRDGSVEYLTRRYPRVKIVASRHNLGFARANNVAIRQSEGEYVLLLNPDTFVAEDVIAEVLRFMDQHPDAGAAGVRMLTATGADAMESRRGLPSPMTSFYKMCGLCTRFPRSRRFGRYYMSWLPWDEAARIEILSGAFCMLRRSALDKVGLLDETFFMYGEDIDLSYRLLKGGYENWYVPVHILHYKGESTKKSSFRYIHVFYEAMLIFFRKHYGHLSFLLSIPITMAIYAKASIALVKMIGQRMRKSLGFFTARQEREPEYVFIGSSSSLARCKRVASREGLTFSLLEGDAVSRPDGHLSEELPEGLPVCVVYDTSAYSYKDILRIFSVRPDTRVTIGTYDPYKKIIITPTEIFR